MGKLSVKLQHFFLAFVLILATLVTPIVGLAQETASNTAESTSAAPAPTAPAAAAASEATQAPVASQESASQEESSDVDVSDAQPANASAAAALASVNGAAKELHGVLDNAESELYDISLSRLIPQDNDGNYQVVRGLNYRYKVGFDLTGYDGELNNGDYFKINISAPATLRDGQVVQLIDKATGLAIGQGVVSANGTNAGGSITVTLQNLEEYLSLKGGTEVYNVKGSLWFDWSTTTSEDRATLIGSDSANASRQIWGLVLSNRQRSTYDTGYNFAKRHGAIKNEPYDSPTLGKSGTYVHGWTADVNYRQSPFNQLTLHDEIDKTGGPMQFIPESFKITTGTPNDQLYLDNAQEVPSSEYTITFSDNYTKYDIQFHNPSGKAFKVTYQTTSPADGSTVANIISATGDGDPLEQKPGSGRMTMRAQSNSKVTDGGVIQADTRFRVVVLKIDTDTNEPLAGAEFELRKADGTVIKLAPTGTDGRSISPAFATSEAGQEIEVVETKAPDGYEVAGSVKATIEADGTFVTVRNKRQTTPSPSSSESESSSSSSSDESSSSSSSESSSSSSSESSSSSSSESSSSSSSESSSTSSSESSSTESSSNESSSTASDGLNPNDPKDETGGRGQNGQPSRPTNKNQLPHTGEVASWLAIAVAIVLVAIGGYLLFRRRKQQ